MKNYINLGRDVNRLDGYDKVSGNAKYIADYEFPGMLYAKVLRSPHPHAEIISINTSAAEKMEGVIAVTHSGKCSHKMGLYLVDRPVFATGKVRFKGEPVAAVAALTEDIAAAAIKKIKVRYKMLPLVDNIEDALKKNATLVHPDLMKYSYLPIYYPKKGTNIFNHFPLRKGDIKKGFKQSHKIYENEFTLPQIQHVPMEPHGALAKWDRNDKLTVYSSVQSPFTLRNLLRLAFGLSHKDVRVIAPYVGGGFGGKAGINMEPLAVALAKEAKGKWIKLIFSREEVFLGTTVRQAMRARVKTGISKNGRIIAEDIEMVFDGGAYAEYGTNVVRAAGYTCIGPYDIENVKGDTYGVYTNHLVGGAFRGFGHGELHWAVESQMDIIANDLKMDPAEFRRLNVLKPGSINSMGEKITKHTGNMVACIDAVAKDLKWGKSSKKPAKPYIKRGKGLAVLEKAPAMPANATSCARVKFNEDATVIVHFSGMEIGQGCITALTQIAAERLKMDVSKLHAAGLPDTDFSPYEWQTVASRITWAVGNAIINAVDDAHAKIKKVAAKVLKVKTSQLDIDGEKVFVIGNKRKSIALPLIIMGYQYPDGHTIGGPVEGVGTFTPNLTNLDAKTGQGHAAAEWTFGCEGAEIEVDTRTGEMKILNLVGAFDLGTVINPSTARGQIIGGMIQGLGSAVLEELKYKDGKIANPSFVDYKIPTAADLPDKIKHIFIQTPDDGGPFGARAIGEHPMISIPPAIANAIYDAIGVRIKALPLTDEKILSSLKEKK
ncbi:xanthine dehydrogenase family protein molybdopterin-binding subunit [bacterium]|nr:xanthine dehydrogenase family protein molybdopterin-binding subunit [bacterium]